MYIYIYESRIASRMKQREGIKMEMQECDMHHSRTTRLPSPRSARRMMEDLREIAVVAVLRQDLCLSVVGLVSWRRGMLCEGRDGKNSTGGFEYEHCLTPLHHM